jgi:2-iminobutanoate/2-iminopropanoate deaminase
MMRSMHVRSMCLGFFLLTASAGAAEKVLVQPPGTPAGRPFSPGILANGTLYVAGQVGTDPKTGKIPDNFEDEVKQTLTNIGVVLKEAGYDFKDAVTVQVYLTDMELFSRMNAVYIPFFPEPRPVRTTVGVAKLVGTAKIEITVTAWKDPGPVKKQKRKQK